MCGRITQRLSDAEIARYFDADPLEGAAADPTVPRFNLAPTQVAVVVVGEGSRRVLTRFEWGIRPGDGPLLINARAETIRTNAAFRESFRSRRCIVPADAFFEWQHAGGGRQPFLVRRRDGEPLALAAVWKPAASGASPGRPPTFAIVTTAANEVVGRLHDRMPVVLEAGAWALWLDPGARPDDLAHLFRPASSASLEAYPVSRRVNDVRNDDATLTEPLARVPAVLEQPGLFDVEPDAGVAS